MTEWVWNVDGVAGEVTQERVDDVVHCILVMMMTTTMMRMVTATMMVMIGDMR